MDDEHAFLANSTSSWFGCFRLGTLEPELIYFNPASNNKALLIVNWLKCTDNLCFRESTEMEMDISPQAKIQRRRTTTPTLWCYQSKGAGSASVIKNKDTCFCPTVVRQGRNRLGQYWLNQNCLINQWYYWLE